MQLYSIVENSKRKLEKIYSSISPYSNFQFDEKIYDKIKQDIDKQKNLGQYAEKDLEVGNKYFKEKQFQEAIKYYEKGVEYNVFLGMAYFNQGNVFYEINKFDEAIKNYQKAIEKNPDYAEELYHSLGKLYYYECKLDKSIIYYKQYYEDILEVLKEEVQNGDTKFLYYITDNYNLFKELMEIPYNFVDGALHEKIKINIKTIDEFIITKLKERIEKLEQENTEYKNYKDKYEQERLEKEELQKRITIQQETRQITGKVLNLEKPQKAPELYAQRTNKKEDAESFFRRVYKPWLDKGIKIYQFDLRNSQNGGLDHQLMKGIENQFDNDREKIAKIVPRIQDKNDQELINPYYKVILEEPKKVSALSRAQQRRMKIK